MKNIIFNKWTTLTLAIAVVILTFCLIGRAQTKPVEQEPIIKYVEVVNDKAFDTSIIEQAWCGSFTDGTIRMVGAWYYTDGVVEDNQGQLWAVEESVTAEDFLLLWIADNNTPNKTTDDIIIKVWREAH
jgi:hypothetical protein